MATTTPLWWYTLTHSRRLGVQSRDASAGGEHAGAARVDLVLLLLMLRGLVCMAKRPKCTTAC